jgi:arylsulfatase A-like enzyme
MHRIACSCLLLLGVFSLLGVIAKDGQAAEAKPNIVFLLIDDLGYADCGFNGGKEIATPQIDKLARGGTILTSHYVQPVCSPTRAALMTGRYATHTGVYTVVRPHAKWGLPLAERTLANALKEAGYATAIVGKWHLGEFDPAYLPTSRGFDHHYGHYFGALDYFTHLRDGELDWYRDRMPLKEEGYSTNLLGREACRVIEKHDQTKPLFLYVPFNGVHSPFESPAEYLKPYNGLQGNRRTLAGMLAAVDEAIGQIAAALDKAGMRENTLIVFSSDNGGPRPGDNLPLKGFKGSIWEGGVRGCAFANWPEHIPAGVNSDQPLHVIDWYPTLVKLGGGSLEQKLPIDGLDVWPMLTQGAKSPHEAILLVKSPNEAAVRMGDWKLTMNAEVPTGGAKAGAKAPGKKGAGKKVGKRAVQPAQAPLALYNLATDIGETTNLAAQEPERVATMKGRLQALLKDAAVPGQLAAGFQ